MRKRQNQRISDYHQREKNKTKLGNHKRVGNARCLEKDHPRRRETKKTGGERRDAINPQELVFKKGEKVVWSNPTGV